MASEYNMDNTDMDNSNMDNTDMDNSNMDNTDMDNTNTDNIDMNNTNTDNTNMDNTNMDNAVLIPPEALLPIVNKYFDRVSSAHWSMLAAGTLESATEATLADMLIEIIQTYSTAILRIVLPIFKKRMLTSASQADLTTVLENFTTPLGNSLPDSFAVALHVPQDKCESAEKLTALVEREISQKVTSVVSVAINSTVWPEEPAVFVTGAMSNITSLHQMVIHATQCLKRHLGKLNSQCLALCWRPKNEEPLHHTSSEATVQILETEEPEKCQSPQSLKSAISVPSATKAVSDILAKWSSETPDTEEEADNALLPLSTSPDVHDTASEIISAVVDDLQYPDTGDVARCSEKSRPHFNMGFVQNKVRDFFASQAAPADNTANEDQKVCKQGFLKFAQQQFDKVMLELKTSFETKDANFLVSLKQDSESQRKLIEDDDSDDATEDILPGADPESPRPKSESCSRTSKTTMISVRMQQSSPLDFESIKDKVDSLFHKLNLPEKPAADASKTLDTSTYRVQIKKFSMELTDKMYSHLMTGQTYQIPMAPLGRSLSESVISQFSGKVVASQFHFSPEVLYVMTEDAVGKFLQQVLLWLEKESSNQTIQSDKVSGALNDITDLLTTMLTTIEENVNKPESIEASDRQSTTACCSRSGSPAEDPAQSTGVISPKVTSEPAPVSPCSEKSGEGHVAVSNDTSSPATKKIANNFITALVMRLFTKAPRKARRSVQMADINTIIERLAEKVLGESIMTSSAEKNLKRINKAVIKDLGQEFGSLKKTLEAAMASNDTSFDDAVVKYLRVHVLSPPPKSAVSRFFSAVGKTLSTTFQWRNVNTYNLPLFYVF